MRSATSLQTRPNPSLLIRTMLSEPPEVCRGTRSAQQGASKHEIGKRGKRGQATLSLISNSLYAHDLSPSRPPPPRSKHRVGQPLSAEIDGTPSPRSSAKSGTPERQRDPVATARLPTRRHRTALASATRNHRFPSPATAPGSALPNVYPASNQALRSRRFGFGPTPPLCSFREGPNRPFRADPPQKE